MYLFIAIVNNNNTAHYCNVSERFIFDISPIILLFLSFLRGEMSPSPEFGDTCFFHPDFSHVKVF